jgi:transposase
LLGITSQKEGKLLMRLPYPSDISREQFTIILPLLESIRKKTRPRSVDLYEVFCAVLFVLKSGCQWRMLPRDFPKWRTCYSYFQQWNETQENGLSLLENALKKSGWRGSAKQWTQRENELSHRRRTEREKHGYHRTQGV